MSILGIMAFGAVAGWLTSLLLGTDAGIRMVLNAAVGLVGACVVGLIVAPMLLQADGQLFHVDWQILLASLFGAMGFVRLLGEARAR